MTPIEKFNKDLWYVLEHIKERSLYTKEGDAISYTIYFDTIVPGCPSAEDEVAILEKLEEWQAIKMRNPDGLKAVFYIEIIQPKFNELYEERQSDEYQKKVEVKYSANNLDGYSGERLKKFKDTIVSSSKSAADLRNLIGIELFDFIQENTLLKECFYKHLYYLRNLATDKDFIKLQDDFIDTVIKILKLTNSKEIEILQEEYNNKVLNRLKIVVLDGFITLPEFYEALLNKSSYHRLGDKNSYTEMEKELSWLTHIMPLLNQLDSIDGFLTRVTFKIFGKNPSLKKKSGTLLEEYSALRFRIYNLVHNMTIKLHVKDFERFFIFCAEIRPIPEYEGFYEINKNSTEYSKYADRLEVIKKHSEIVIDDLIESCDVNEQTLKNTSEPYKINSNSSLSTNENKPKLLITKNNSGEFLFGDKPLKFENTNTIYFKIFDALYEKADATSFCSYGEINKFLQESGEETLTDRAKIVERISNGLKNLFRYSNLPKDGKIQGGNLLIKPKRGKGLIFYNPPV